MALSPRLPFGWISRPPSLNRLIGLNWLASIFYPKLAPSDLRTETRRFYRLFCQVELDEDWLDHLLGTGRRHVALTQARGPALADPYDQLPAITFWLLGSLAGSTAGDRGAVPAVLLGLAPLLLLHWRIDMLALGDEEARALGVEAVRLRRIVVAAATLVTAAVVAISGQIGWVGLVVPHIARILVGPGFARLLPTSMLMGAGYLLLVDTAARSLGTVETPLGILTALVGAPFFLWLLARGRTGWA